VLPAQQVGFAAPFKALQRIFADGLQHHKARLAIPTLLSLEQAAVHIVAVLG
jgi:hypothetical protein